MESCRCASASTTTKRRSTDLRWAGALRLRRSSRPARTRPPVRSGRQPRSRRARAGSCRRSPRGRPELAGPVLTILRRDPRGAPPRRDDMRSRRGGRSLPSTLRGSAEQGDRVIDRLGPLRHAVRRRSLALRTVPPRFVAMSHVADDVRREPAAPIDPVALARTRPDVERLLASRPQIRFATLDSLVRAELITGTLRGAVLDSSTGAFELRAGVVRETIVGPMSPARFRVHRARRFRRVRSVERPAISLLGDQWAGRNYYHWLVDVLPCAMALASAPARPLRGLADTRSRCALRERVSRSTWPPPDIGSTWSRSHGDGVCVALRHG